MIRRIGVLLLFALLLAAEAEAKKKRRGRTRNGVQATGNFWSVLKITYLCVFLPMVLMFVFAIVRDPISKKVAKELWRRAKGRAVAFLGKSSRHGQRQGKDRKVQERETAASSLRSKTE